MEENKEYKINYKRVRLNNNERLLIRKRPKKIIVMALIILITLIAGTIAFLGVSDNFDVFSKIDTGATGTEANSASFIQRFISGFLPVGNYISSTFSGRFGILDSLGNLSTPSIYLVSPFNGKISNQINQTLQYYYINGTMINCSLYLNGVLNDTVDAPASDTILNFSKTFSDNIYLWKIVCTQLEGIRIATYFSGTNNLRIDTIAPIITINVPLNQTYSSSRLTFNVSANENIDTCFSNLDNSGNVSMLKENSTYFTLANVSQITKSYNVYFICNDSAGNIGFSSVNYSVVLPKLSVNVTSPLQFVEVARGRDNIAGEDDLGLVSNNMDFISKVYVNETNVGVPDINLSFYLDNLFISNNLTNSSGYSIASYDKSSQGIGVHNVLVNYSTDSITDYDIAINSVNVTFSIVQYLVPNDVGNKGEADVYVDGQTAILYFNVTKTNETGTFFYDPLNISVNATTSAGILYYDLEYVPSYRVHKDAVGQYQSQVTVNKTKGSYIRWNVYLSDDNFSSFIATAVHYDIGIVNTSVCGNTLLEAGEACDDGNFVNGDGCSSTCTIEIPPCPQGQTRCSDGVCKTDCGGGCFIAGTKISMEDGTNKSIEDVREGEKVVSYDESINGSVGSEVIKTFVHNNENYLIINDILKVTKNHPLYVNGNWVEAGKVNLGDNLLNLKGELIVIKSIKELNENSKVYNLEVDRTHNYFAENILVHNKGGCTSSYACSSWTTCSGGTQTRTCTDSNSCPGAKDRTETQLCTSQCTENWDCDFWSECSNGFRTRVCNDLGLCKPPKTESEVCNPLCIEDWQCGDWESCLLGTQIRTCTDQANNNAGCGTEEYKPIISQSCSCTENWQCTNWLPTSCNTGETQTRTCTDNSTCGTTNDKPTETKACGTCSEDWKCTDWNSCYNKKQTRTCTDQNIPPCGTTVDKPTIEQSCTCNENWECEWTTCSQGDEFSYPFSCVDSSNCGSGDDMPTLPKSCANVVRNNSYFVNGKYCTVDWKCSKWNECRADYSIDDVLEGKSSAKGMQDRICNDENECSSNKTEKKSCTLSIPIEAKETTWCAETYVEIYNKETSQLVSRVKQSEIQGVSLIKRVDVSFVMSEFGGYCDYCYDGVKNHDEVGTDCGGKSCPICISPYFYFDWLFWLILILWSIEILFMIWGVIAFRKKIKEKISGRNLLEKLTPSKKRDLEIEKKIESRFKRLMKAIASKIRFRIKLERIKSVERGERVNKERERIKPQVVENAIVAKSRITPQEAWYRRLLRKTRTWRVERYYGTARLEKELEKAKREAYLENQRVQRNKGDGQKTGSVVKLVKSQEGRKYEEKSLREKERKRTEHGKKKELKRIEHLRKKEKKREIKTVKKEIRKRQIANLMAKLKMWKKQGYYGTEELKKKLEKLKRKI